MDSLSFPASPAAAVRAAAERRSVSRAILSNAAVCASESSRIGFQRAAVAFAVSSGTGPARAAASSREE